MTKNFRSFLKYSVLAVLIAVTALSFLSCEKDAETTGAEITITVEVVHKSGESAEHTLTTTKTTLADALLEASLASGNEDTYGLYITTVDGEVFLWSNRPGGWDGCYSEIVIDYNYKIDFDKTESIENFIEHDTPVFALGTPAVEEPAPEPITVVKNDPLVFVLWLGGGLVLGAVFTVIGLVIRKRKAVQK